ncbi:hypothetical protein [Paenibacillus polymyxa]
MRFYNQSRSQRKLSKLPAEEYRKQLIV